MSEERDRILGNLVRAVHVLEDSEEFASLVPEVRVNIVYALEGASESEDVGAIDGRISTCRGSVKVAGYPRFGASDHMARLVIEVRKYDERYRAGINFAWTREISSFLEKYASDRKWKFGKIDRRKEPEEVAQIDGQSMPWKIRQLLEEGEGTIPKLFYESEGWGKEPLFVLLGVDALQVALEAAEIARALLRENRGFPSPLY
jgi:hydroxymethylpyrimidine/phosphomethylpyrimidine kinase